MVTLPKDFVATRYPGYFWNVVERKLYTLKVTGELRPMHSAKGAGFTGEQLNLVIGSASKDKNVSIL